jgi:two-component system phosphate regulon response regulator PhoB
VFSRGQLLLDGVQGTGVCIAGRTVDVHAGRLRKAPLQDWSSDPIRTARGAGHSFEAI